MTSAADRPLSPLPPLSMPAANECVVWRSPVIAGRWEPFGLLDRAERERCARFHRAADRARFVTAHTVLRLLLGACLDLDPAALSFTNTCVHCGAQHGKPRLADVESTVDFSLSHAEDRVLVAIARHPVGVDIEHLNPALDVAELVEQTLSPAERTWFDRLPPERRQAAFYLCWTRKEAVLKATAHGLTIPMTRLSTTPPDRPAELVDWTAEEPLPAPVRLRDLAAEPSYRACVAVLGADEIRVIERDVPRPS